jgi:DNA mismatch repair protein MutL
MPLLAAPRVRLLDPHTINQIAAGEVVERPASVVKELVENAIDAGATRIQVELAESGRSLIRVSDDGCGMEAEDAVQALQRHATSKISSADDLLLVGSLGFRGEALPSIASVSRFTLSTAVADGRRTLIRVTGGEMQPLDVEAGPRGTTITVEDLFFNTPARLKFLKSDASELGACLDHLSRYALAYPAIAFRVTHGTQEALVTSGSGDLHQTITEVWGRDTGRSLAEIDIVAAGVEVKGFVSPPHVTRPTRACQFLFVNGRPVRSRTLTVALDQAFRDLTPERRYPIVVLHLRLDPAKVDVNVSPTKSEVKFQHEGQAFDAIRYSIRTGLLEHGMMPSAGAVATVNEALAALRPSPPAIPQPSAIDLFAASSMIPEQATTFSPGAVATNSERFPFAELLEGLRIVGQAMNTFIIAETARGIVIVDQHVAHERILYEYLCGLKGATAVETQALLAPETLHLDRRSAVLLSERLAEVRAVGYDIEPFGGEAYIVRSAPAALRGKDPIAVLRDLVDELVETAVTRRLVPTREQIWITSACKMAVKAGDLLTHAEMEKLILDLATTENPYLCPHGRPITITLGKDELLRKFKR